jgi:uncharacterized protein (UPF0218 family)
MPLDEGLRARLAEPFGEVLEFGRVRARLGAYRPPHLIAVGDQTLMHLFEAGLKPDVGIFDRVCRRRPIPPEWERVIEQAIDEVEKSALKAGAMAGKKQALPPSAGQPPGNARIPNSGDRIALSHLFSRVPNPPGTIHPKMEAEVRKVLATGLGWIEILGEDDLCSLVVMAYARMGSVLLYGQPDAGMVWVEIDAKKRQEARALLEQIKK